MNEGIAEVFEDFMPITDYSDHYELSSVYYCTTYFQGCQLKIMRIDKFLKVSRILKRRTLAQQACDKGKVIYRFTSMAKPKGESSVK